MGTADAEALGEGAAEGVVKGEAEGTAEEEALNISLNFILREEAEVSKFPLLFINSKWVPSRVALLLIFCCLFTR